MCPDWLTKPRDLRGLDTCGTWTGLGVALWMQKAPAKRLWWSRTDPGRWHVKEHRTERRPFEASSGKEELPRL